MILGTLGGLRLDGASCDRRKPLLLVAYLALEGPQPRDRLAPLFWPATTDPRNRLTVALSRLRKEAPGSVDAGAKTVSTHVAHDVAGLREAVERRDQAAIRGVYAGALLEGVDLPDVGSELDGWILETRETLGR